MFAIVACTSVGESASTSFSATARYLFAGSSRSQSLATGLEAEEAIFCSSLSCARSASRAVEPRSARIEVVPLARAVATVGATERVPRDQAFAQASTSSDELRPPVRCVALSELMGDVAQVVELVAVYPMFQWSRGSGNHLENRASSQKEKKRTCRSFFSIIEGSSLTTCTVHSSLTTKNTVI